MSAPKFNLKRPNVSEKNILPEMYVKKKSDEASTSKTTQLGPFISNKFRHIKKEADAAAANSAKKIKISSSLIVQIMIIALFSVFFKKILSPSLHRYRLSFLTFVFLFYLFCGSYIHLLLNAHVELEERIKLTEFINKFYSTHTCIDERETKKFLDFILTASSVNGIVLGQNGHNNESTEYPPSWQFGGETIFFTFTLLSTIGYGYLTPSTDNGKLFCVFYILIGVPLTFLIFYNISERIEYAIENLSKNQTTIRIINEEENEIPENYTENVSSDTHAYLKCACVGFLIIIFFYILPGILFSNMMEYPSWSFLDAIYFCYISISTVGFGDFIPGRGLTAFARDNYRLAMTVYLFIGIIFNMVFTNMLMKLPFIKNFNEKCVQKPFINYTHLSDENVDDDILESQEDVSLLQHDDIVVDGNGLNAAVIRTNISNNHKTKIV